MRGTINAPEPKRRTLDQLHIPRRYRATIVIDNEIYHGMLHAAKEYISWSVVEAPLIAKILEKRAKKKGGKPLTTSDLKEMGYKSYLDLAKALAKGESSMNRLSNLKPFFSLAPPKGGFKRSIRRSYNQGGLLGDNPSLPQLVEAML